jgi:mono/diheme cytochrome c family protein
MLFSSLPDCSSEAQPGRGRFLVLSVFLLYWLAVPTGGSEPQKAISRSPRNATDGAIVSRASRAPSVDGDAIADRASRGNSLYRQYCQRCHGPDGRGVERRRGTRRDLPNFTRHAWHESRSDGLLKASILDGKGRGMPSFADRLDAEQIQDLVAYVRTLDPAPERLSQNPPSDFDRRFDELRKQWDALRKAYRDSSRPPREP